MSAPTTTGVSSAARSAASQSSCSKRWRGRSSSTRPNAHTPDPAAVDFYPEWDRLASELVAALRSEAGRDPYDRSLQDLIGELSTRSDEFRVRWAAHNVRFHQTGTKRLHHPVVGELELSYETLTLDADDGLRVAVFTAEPGSASQQALNLLASWTATPDSTERRVSGETREH